MNSVWYRATKLQGQKVQGAEIEVKEDITKTYDVLFMLDMPKEEQEEVEEMDNSESFFSLQEMAEWGVGGEAMPKSVAEFECAEENERKNSIKEELTALLQRKCPLVEVHLQEVKGYGKLVFGVRSEKIKKKTAE